MTGSPRFLWLVAMLLATSGREALSQTNYPRAGWETHLTQTGHGVRGTATILDSRTLRLTHFSYDGFAPDMYVYLGTNRTTAAFQNGLTVSPRLARAYEDQTYTVQLPDGQSLDGWNAVSIWCRQVQASFGSGTFAPPVQPTLGVTKLSNALEIKLSGEAGQNYWLFTSTNLLNTNSWQPLIFLPNVTGTIRYTNAPATNRSALFFHAVRD